MCKPSHTQRNCRLHYFAMLIHAIIRNWQNLNYKQTSNRTRKMRYMMHSFLPFAFSLFLQKGSSKIDQHQKTSVRTPIIISGTTTGKKKPQATVVIATPFVEIPLFLYLKLTNSQEKQFKKENKITFNTSPQNSTFSLFPIPIFFSSQQQQLAAFRSCATVK